MTAFVQSKSVHSPFISLWYVPRYGTNTCKIKKLMCLLLEENECLIFEYASILPISFTSFAFFGTDITIWVILAHWQNPSLYQLGTWLEWQLPGAATSVCRQGPGTSFQASDLCFSSLLSRLLCRDKQGDFSPNGLSWRQKHCSWKAIESKSCCTPTTCYAFDISAMETLGSGTLFIIMMNRLKISIPPPHEFQSSKCH